MQHTENLEITQKILSQFMRDIQKECSSSDIRTRSYRLLYANPKIHKNFQNNRLLYDFPLPTTFKNSAIDDFSNWYTNWKKSNPEKRKEIPFPKEDETLIVYLRRLQSCMEEMNQLTSSLWRSLQSFILFLREKYFNESGIIDFLFPEVMKHFDNKIIRNIPPSAYPVDIATAAHLIENLIMTVLCGRKNARLNAAHALAFSWICLTAARIRFPTHLKVLHALQKQAVDAKQNLIYMPTFCGDIPVTISSVLTTYLLELTPKSQVSKHVILPPLSTLRRIFERAVTRIPETEQLGKITFLTLMSPPHEVHKRRYIPK